MSPLAALLNTFQAEADDDAAAEVGGADLIPVRLIRQQMALTPWQG